MSCSREKKTYTSTSPPPLFFQARQWGKKMAGTNEFAFFRCRSIRTGGGFQNQTNKIQKMPPGWYRYENLLFQCRSISPLLAFQWQCLLSELINLMSQACVCTAMHPLHFQSRSLYERALSHYILSNRIANCLPEPKRDHVADPFAIAHRSGSHLGPGVSANCFCTKTCPTPPKVRDIPAEFSVYPCEQACFTGFEGRGREHRCPG